VFLTPTTHKLDSGTPMSESLEIPAGTWGENSRPHMYFKSSSDSLVNLQLENAGITKDWLK